MARPRTGSHFTAAHRPVVLAIALLTLLAPLALVVLLAPAASATTHYVDLGGGGDFTAIKDAVTAASSGDTVLIAAGTYSGTSNTDIDFEGKSLIVVSESGPDVTIIDCAGGSPYRRGFYFHSGEDTTAVVDGIHITSGVSVTGGGINCTGASPLIKNCVFTHCGVAYGGAIHMNNASPVIRGCLFQNNDVFVSGGALWAENASPTITDCVIDSCTSGFLGGGMIHFDGGSSTLRSVVFSNCSSGGNGAGFYCEDAPCYLYDVEFIGNIADSTDGGGMFVNCDATLVDCVFDGNYAGGNGAGFWCMAASPTLTNCDFISNTSDAAGGGLYSEEAQFEISGGSFSGNFAAAGGGIYAYGAMPEITGADFVENEAVIMGGAICCEDAMADIDDCTFERNVSWYQGGAIHAAYMLMPNITNSSFVDNNGSLFGGAIFFEEGFGGVIESCTFKGNTAESGAAINAYGGASPNITSCTLQGNVAYLDDGAISSTDSSPAISNTIIADTEIGAAMVCGGTPVPTTTHSCSHGNAAGDSLCGAYHDNMFDAPLFCDAPGGNLTLHDDSPCLAANNSWGELVARLESAAAARGRVSVIRSCRHSLCSIRQCRIRSRERPPSGTMSL
ncbi:hypothetical protein K8S17_04550 [bacterium]|nr:hypothetical protein [bacterium]